MLTDKSTRMQLMCVGILYHVKNRSFGGHGFQQINSKHLLLIVLTPLQVKIFVADAYWFCILLEIPRREYTFTYIEVEAKTDFM